MWPNLDPPFLKDVGHREQKASATLVTMTLDDDQDQALVHPPFSICLGTAYGRASAAESKTEQRSLFEATSKSCVRDFEWFTILKDYKPKAG